MSLSMRTFFVATVVLALPSLARPAQAQCDRAISRTTRPPVEAGPNTITYVHVSRVCSGDPLRDRECWVGIHPLSSWSLAQKCHALANAIMNDTSPTGCQAKHFTILADNCDAAPTGNNSFTVVDSKNPADPDFCGTDSVALGVSGSSGTFSETGDGFRTVPDYEAELITPGCTTSAGAPVMHQMAIAGTGSGLAISTGQAAAIEAFVSSGGTIQAATVPTTAGMTAAAVVGQLIQKLRALGVNVSAVDQSPGVPASVAARMLRITQPSQGGPIGLSVQVNDLRMATSSEAGTLTSLQKTAQEQDICAINPAACKVATTPVPAMGEWGLLLLALGLLGWAIRLARRSASGRLAS